MMAICEKCEKEYLTKECLRCKNEKPLNEKEKLYKTIRYAIIFFIGVLVTGTIADIIITSYVIKKAEPSINNINKMTNEMVEANRKLMKEINKGFKTPNFNR